MSEDHIITEIKKNLKVLIENRKFQEAQILLEQYQQLRPNDFDIYSIRAVYEMMQHNWKNAEEVIIEGLKIKQNDFDLLFNLAFINEQKEQYHDALNYYKQAYSINSNDRGLNQKIEKLSEKLNLKKVVFFSKKGGDKFLGDIVEHFSKIYNVKKITVTHQNQIEEGMKWADICWFEWCDDLISYGSKLHIAKEKKIICRLHSYETFTPDIKNVKWSAVDKIIFVAEHIRKLVLQQLPDLDVAKTIVIPNGINIDKFKLVEKDVGYNIAYVGYINFKKGPMLLLHVFNTIYKRDNRYKLYIAGQFQEPRYALYFEQMIREMGLEKNVIFEGWQENIDSWLVDKHYILSTSVLEGHPVGIMEAMARGLKPLIHNFVGAREIYPSEFIWNTIDDCYTMLTDIEFSPIKYRAFIKNNYSFECQLNSLNTVLSDLLEDSKNRNDKADRGVSMNLNPSQNDVTEFYDEFLEYLKMDRERDNPRHSYIKNRLKKIIHEGDNVLDLGCGIGITTEYIDSLGVSEVIGVDLSPKLFEYARDTVENIEFIVHDITTLELGKKFDVISICDVMEHVPRERYPDLFRVIKSHLKENGKVFISIPDPDYLNFIREIMPEKLQIIDNSITLEEVNKLCRNNNMQIKHFNVYSIFIDNEYNEYILINSETYGDSWEILRRASKS